VGSFFREIEHFRALPGEVGRYFRWRSNKDLTILEGKMQRRGENLDDSLYLSYKSERPGCGSVLSLPVTAVRSDAEIRMLCFCSSEKGHFEQHLHRFGEAGTQSEITSQSTQRISYSTCSANGLIQPRRLEPCKWRNLW
jgi:hypothetical protein